MKFFWSMVAFILLIIGAFYLGYQTDLGPVDTDSDASQYGYGAEEEPVGGIRGGSGSSSGFGTGRGGSRPSAPARQCLEGARC